MTSEILQTIVEHWEKASKETLIISVVAYGEFLRLKGLNEEFVEFFRGINEEAKTLKAQETKKH